MAGRKATKYPGVYERAASAQTFKGKPDIAFDIAYRHEGRKVWEKVGWLSEGYSAQLAADIRSERIRSKRHGEELPHQKKRAVTFGELAAKYLKWSAANKTRKGIDDQSRYDCHLKRFADNRLDEISPFDLEKLKSDMGKAKMAPKTIAHCLGLIRSMYNRAAAWNLYQGPNPVAKVKMPVVQNARDRFLSFEEAEILLTELKRNPRYKNAYKPLEDPKLHDIALLSLHTGARASEIFNLKGQDIDFQNGLITLRDTKNTETRYAPMTAKAREVLKARRPDNPSAHVFTDGSGRRIKEVSNAFERVIERLKFNEGVADPRQRVCFHTLRHSFASWLAIQGTPILTIARLMGHKSISMSERYSHLSPDHKRDAINGLEAAINGRGERTTHGEPQGGAIGSE